MRQASRTRRLRERILLDSDFIRDVCTGQYVNCPQMSKILPTLIPSHRIMSAVVTHHTRSLCDHFHLHGVGPDESKETEPLPAVFQL